MKSVAADDLHEARIKDFMARAIQKNPSRVRRICGHHSVKTVHQLAHIRRRELDFDPALLNALDWSDRMAVGGQPVIQGI